MRESQRAVAKPKPREIDKIALIVRPESPELADACSEVIAIFERFGVEVCVLESSVKSLGLDSRLACKESELGERAQALVSLGGDGTLISAVRISLGLNLPVLGINMGRLGFLTAIKPSELEEFVPLLRSGEYALDSHHLLQGYLARDSQGDLSVGRHSRGGFLTNDGDCYGKSAGTHAQARAFDSPYKAPFLPQISCHEQTELESKSLDSSENIFYVLNEILITKKDISGMTKIYATINNEHFHTYRADGLIIATPTGSSAYNISAGGSLVHPQCRVILLTPVCAHSLTQRPMIVSDSFCLQFSVEEDSVIMLDGQERIDFRKGDTLFVQGSFPIQLIQHPKRSYFAVLEEKFGLGGKQV